MSDDEDRQRRRGGGHDDVADTNNSDATVAFSPRATEGSPNQGRRPPRHHRETQPEGIVRRELQVHAESHRLHPAAEGRDKSRRPRQSEISVGEGSPRGTIHRFDATG